MRFSAAASVLLAQFFAGAAAHGQGHGWGRGDWVRGLPRCWVGCLESSSDGCDSKNCICESSQDAEYLTSAVECLLDSCSADGSNVALTFVAPLQMYCAATREDIPASVMSAAYACATETPKSATPTSTRQIEHSTKENAAHRTTKEASNELESTITSTVTLTTTNGDGNTLQVLIPIIMGPDDMTTGDLMTSTLDSKPTASSITTSTAEAGVEPTAPAPSQTQASNPSSTAPEASNIGGGSPFDISTGEAGHWGFSTILLGAGMVFGTLARI